VILDVVKTPDVCRDYLIGVESKSTAPWLTICMASDASTKEEIEACSDVVTKALESFPEFAEELANLRDAHGRTSYDVAVPPCRRAMDAVILFAGKYRLKMPPEHQSATSTVILAEEIIDEAAKITRTVAIKFFSREAEFLRETRAREGFDLSPDYTIGIMKKFSPTKTNAGHKCQWSAACEEKGLPPWAIVMPAGERNLLVARAQERMSGKEMSKLMQSLARGLGHMHSQGLIHGDFKPLNALRCSESKTWKLIDYDAASKIGGPVACKYSEAYIAPEYMKVCSES